MPVLMFALAVRFLVMPFTGPSIHSDIIPPPTKIYTEHRLAPTLALSRFDLVVLAIPLCTDNFVGSSHPRIRIRSSSIFIVFRASTPCVIASIASSHPPRHPARCPRRISLSIHWRFSCLRPHPRQTGPFSVRFPPHHQLAPSLVTTTNCARFSSSVFGRVQSDQTKSNRQELTLMSSSTQPSHLFLDLQLEPPSPLTPGSDTETLFDFVVDTTDSPPSTAKRRLLSLPPRPWRTTSHSNYSTTRASSPAAFSISSESKRSCPPSSIPSISWPAPIPSTVRTR